MKTSEEIFKILKDRVGFPFDAGSFSLARSEIQTFIKFDDSPAAKQLKMTYRGKDFHKICGVISGALEAMGLERQTKKESLAMLDVNVNEVSKILEAKENLNAKNA